ncbi:CMP-2-keto-3-deoxyoctulosonic acid synthetase [Bradyrhizobium sp. GM2.4]
MIDPRILVLIPARMAATRLPGKPLADIAGQPMIVHVMRRAEAAGIGRVAVATDTAEIASVVTAHGGEAVMTRPEHPSGSDRIHEAMQKLDPDGKAEIVVNLQGDFPTITIDNMAARCCRRCKTPPWISQRWRRRSTPRRRTSRRAS